MQSRDEHNWNGGDGHLGPNQGPAASAPGSRYSPYARQNLPGSVSVDTGYARDGPKIGPDGTAPTTDLADAQVSRDLPVREKSQDKIKKEKSSRICQKCGEGLTGQFVRALGGTFHLECFRCRDCGDIVASKFFPVDEEDGSGRQYPLCETDYFKRLDLLCNNCGGALRGSYVTALDRKYHIDHFTCSVCPTAFGAKDSYYEHDGMVYCHYHYSTRFAQRCNGCQTAILKQFVEIFRNGQNQHWHPECYMIHKFWSVRLTPSKEPIPEIQPSEENASDEERARVREEEERMEQKTFSIWSILSAFEEASAACISDMLLHVSNGAYVDGVLVAKKFINHVELLFTALDQLDNYVIFNGLSGLQYGREAKLLCKRIVAFFTLLTKTQDTGVKRLGVTQELLSLVTGLAHYLKLLIRIGLQGALKYEREKSDAGGLDSFLNDLSHLETVAQAEVVLEDTASLKELASDQSDLCRFCQSPIDDECLQAEGRRWHHRHLKCHSCGREVSTKESTPPVWNDDDQQGYCGNCRSQLKTQNLVQIESVSRLQQYVYLLRIALARLLQVLRSGGTLPHTSDDPNLQQFDSNEGHRLMPTGQLASTSLRPDASRSKSYAGVGDSVSSFQQSVEDVKRQRSTRLQQRLSTTGRTARTSRIIEGPHGMDLAGKPGFQVVEDRDPNGQVGAALSLSEGTLTLDDIPRIVAAENAKSQRPNAAKYAGDDLLPRFSQPKRRSTGALQALGDPGDKVIDRPKKYFSELSPMEYFIVRHIAVLQMEPLLRDYYNLEELLGLIETRNKSFWKPFFFNKDGKGKGSKKKGVFGVDLSTLVETKGVDSTSGVGPSSLRVPALLDDAVSAMRQMDLSVEGVFRKNGNIKALRETSEKLDSGDNVDLGREKPVQVAALLKKFLREMPDPVLTHKLHDLWLTSQQITDHETRRRICHLACCLLPKPHRDSMEVLFSFLNFAASFSQVDDEVGSKMDIHNIATVIAPNILIPPPTTNVGMDKSFRAVEAVHMLLVYHDEMCEVPEDIQGVLADSSEIFQRDAEVTTKEILKRYGDMTKRADIQKPVAHRPAEFADVRSHNAENNGSAAERAAEGTARRIDNNPQQTKAWQQESSVRHVQGNGQGLPVPPFGRPSQSGSPGQPQGEFGQSRPYHYRHGSNGSSRSQGNNYGSQSMGVI